MKLNWTARIKNRNFWIGLLGVVMMAMGVDASTFTTWDSVLEALKDFINNPYMIGCTIVALWGFVQDFTTKGFGDSDLAMSYKSPKKKGE